MSAAEVDTILQGNVISVLRTLPDNSVHCCVTSPPYWGLRDYKTEPVVFGGAEGCEHEWGDSIPGSARGGSGTPTDKNNRGEGYGRGASRGNVCAKCGAWRGQLGLEPTPEEYVQHLVEVFREVKRVLRDDGNLWLNLGDCYASSPPGNTTIGVSAKSTLHGINGESGAYRDSLSKGHATKRNTIVAGVKPKDLIGIPWRVAFALQADGWYLRSDIIWAKRNVMPESVTDRPTRSHEFIFLMTKNARYYYDAEAIREPLKQGADHDRPVGINPMTGKSDSSKREFNHIMKSNPNGRNKRDVWFIATKPYSDWVDSFVGCDYVGADGRPYKAKSDCPVHGGLHFLLSERRELYGELLNLLSRSNLGIDDNRVLKQFFASFSNSLIPNGKISESIVLRQKIGSKNGNKTISSLTTACAEVSCAESSCRTNRTPDERDAQNDNSDCLNHCNVRVANEHNIQTRKKDRVPHSISSYISFDRTLYDKLRIEEELVKIGWVGHTFESNIWAVWFLNVFCLLEDSSCRIADRRTHNSKCLCSINSLSHFATFPEDLIKPCILAGTSEKGCCPKCGAPWVRKVEVVGKTVTDAMRVAGCDSDGEYHGTETKDYDGTKAQKPSETKRRILESMSKVKKSTWEAGCSCGEKPIPCIVLDPFIGAGTTAVAAKRLGRSYLGIELSTEYVAMAEERILKTFPDKKLHDFGEPSDTS